jgi:hypothetical protein
MLSSTGAAQWVRSRSEGRLFGPALTANLTSGVTCTPPPPLWTGVNLTAALNRVAGTESSLAGDELHEQLVHWLRRIQRDPVAGAVNTLVAPWSGDVPAGGEHLRLAAVVVAVGPPA